MAVYLGKYGHVSHTFKEALITEIPSPLSGSCKRKEVGFQTTPGSSGKGWKQRGDATVTT